MKTLLAIVALATVVASPAMAQSYDPSIGSGNIAPRQQPAPPSSPYDAHAQVTLGVQGHRVHVHPGTALRSPYAQYDAAGRLIDQNMPGRW